MHRQAQHSSRTRDRSDPRTALALAFAAGLVVVLVVAAPALDGPDGVLSSRLAVGALLVVALALALAAAAAWRSPAPRGLVVAAVLAGVLAVAATVIVLVPALVTLVTAP